MKAMEEADKEKPRSVKTKRNGKAATISLIAVLTVVFAVICVLKLTGKVEFQDALVERCVRMTLDKEWDEPITKKECRAIEKLLIDCDQDISFIMPSADGTMEPGNFIDMYDLEYMAGLKELTIDNRVSRDILVNLDAVAYCKQLESLTVRYNPMDYRAHYHTGAYGYKYLAGIVEELPELQYLDPGYTVVKEHQELIAGLKKVRP